MSPVFPLLVAVFGSAVLAVPACNGGTGGEGGTGGSSTGGGNATGGASSEGGSPGAGGATATGGTPGSGGAKATGSGGTTASGGTTGAGGTKGTGGATGSGGATATGAGGTTATGGATGSGGATATGGTTGNCGSTTLNEDPFGCAFAWGTNNPGGSLASYTYLEFMSDWVGSEIQQNGSISSCSGCSWLSGSIASTSLIPVFYAYVIGYLGHANGFPDQNTSTGGASLATGGAYVIRKYRSQIIAAYAYYAQKAHAVWPTKPLVWLLEGDFVQYTDTTQVDYPNASGNNPGSPNSTVEALSYAELGQLASDITCAIKSNMPNAVVAINHSTWNTDQVTTSFWGAMGGVNYDMAWTSGVANNNGFFTTGTTATSYNGKTATYASLHSLIGKTIFVDTSFGASSMGDTWSNSPASTINARIADGVVAANVTTVPSNYSSAVTSLEPSLTKVCAN